MDVPSPITSPQRRYSPSKRKPLKEQVVCLWQELLEEIAHCVVTLVPAIHQAEVVGMRTVSHHSKSRRGGSTYRPEKPGFSRQDVSSDARSEDWAPWNMSHVTCASHTEVTDLSASQIATITAAFTMSIRVLSLLSSPNKALRQPLMVRDQSEDRSLSSYRRQTHPNLEVGVIQELFLCTL